MREKQTQGSSQSNQKKKKRNKSPKRKKKSKIKVDINGVVIAYDDRRIGQEIRNHSVLINTRCAWTGTDW